MKTNTDNKKYILEIGDVYKTYGTHNVLNDIDLKVSKGEFITVVGPSGCGKSTLLKMILGSLKQTTGIILEKGKSITKISRDRGIVFQQYSVFPFMTVEQNVLFGLEIEYFSYFEHNLNKIFKFIQSKKRKEFLELAHEYLDKVGLLEHRNKYPEQLSGGQKQRVAIAQAMVMHPEILLMDEPFGALDVVTREELQFFVKALCEEKDQTIFFVTHELEEALLMGTRLLVLSQYWEKGDTLGAKIMMDIPLSWEMDKLNVVKDSKAFRDLINMIKNDCIDPNHLKKLEEFSLTHKDSIIDHNFKL